MHKRVFYSESCNTKLGDRIGHEYALNNYGTLKNKQINYRKQRS